MMPVFERFLFFGRFFGKLRMRQRVGMPFVASKAPYLGLAFKMILVDGGHHVEHFARCSFLFLIVQVELMRHVAEFAISIQ